jgi:hypothetical protein
MGVLARHARLSILLRTAVYGVTYRRGTSVYITTLYRHIRRPWLTSLPQSGKRHAARWCRSERWLRWVR